MRPHRDDEATIPAFAEDYAFLAMGLLDLYAVSFDVKRLKHAVKLAPYVEWMLPVKGQAAAYVCQDFTCQKPLIDPQELKKQLTVSPQVR